MDRKWAFSKPPFSWRLKDQSLSVQFWVAGGVVAVASLISLVIVLNQAETTFIAIALIGSSLLLIFGVVLSKLYRSLASPLSEVLEAMIQYQKGDFSIRVPVTNRGTVGLIEKNINEMAEKLDLMVGDLKKLDELKSEFISTVSHELRTPLTSIGGYAKLLIGGDAGPLTDTQKEFLKIIDTNVVRLTALINEILDVEALESGKIEFSREPQDLMDILKECVDTFKIVAKQKDLEIRYQVPEDLRPVIGERSRFIQIFMNLISNAIKYTHSGFISVRAEQSDFAVSIHVEDTGVGLSPQDLEKLFQKFFRARSGLTASEGGTGLGLVIVRKLVESFGGNISVDSELDKGTEFTVRFPSIVEPTIQKQTPVQSSSAPMVSKVIPKKVWIIDPVESDVAQMVSLLKSTVILAKGVVLEIRTFKSVSEIPNVVAPKDIPAVMILDPMAGPEGFALTSEVRKKLRRPIPVLVVSSSINTSLALAEGASAILTKPIQEQEFAIAIKDILLERGWRILLADHNTDLRILLKRQFEQEGISIDDVDRGNLVLGRLEKEHYDLTLIEMNLPDVSGLELLKVIRKTSKFDDLPVFLMGEGDKKIFSGNEASEFGMAHIVEKSEGIEGIVNSVFNYLEERGE